MIHMKILLSEFTLHYVSPPFNRVLGSSPLILVPLWLFRNYIEDNTCFYNNMEHASTMKNIAVILCLLHDKYYLSELGFSHFPMAQDLFLMQLIYMISLFPNLALGKRIQA